MPELGLDMGSTDTEKWSYNQTLMQITQTIQKLVHDDGWDYSKYQILIQDGVIRVEVEISNG